MTIKKADGFSEKMKIKEEFHPELYPFKDGHQLNRLHEDFPLIENWEWDTDPDRLGRQSNCSKEKNTPPFPQLFAAGKFSQPLAISVMNVTYSSGRESCQLYPFKDGHQLNRLHEDFPLTESWEWDTDPEFCMDDPDSLKIPHSLQRDRGIPTNVPPPFASHQPPKALLFYRRYGRSS